MQRIGIIDVDSHSGVPNLALMKLSAYHKALGDEVEFAIPLYSHGYYDRIYKSKIFTYTPDNLDIYDCEIVKGGTGYGLYENLPDEIDRLQPDYSLYGIKDMAYGFTTRGCCNACPWCVVPKKEGKVKPYMTIKEIAEGNNTKNVVLFDNNALASDWGLQQMEEAARLKYKVDYNQGLDARKIDMEIAKLLASVKWFKYLRLACDTSSQIPVLVEAIRLLRLAGYNREVFVYCLIRDFEESYNRVKTLYNLNENIVLQVQPYRDPTTSKHIIPQWQKDMAQWANRRWFYRTVWLDDFESRKGEPFRQYIDQYKLIHHDS